jgi:hypothetical protein
VIRPWVVSLNFGFFIPIFLPLNFFFIIPVFFFELYVTCVITVALVAHDSNNPKWECFQNSIQHWVKWCLRPFTLLCASDWCLYIFFFFAVSWYVLVAMLYCYLLWTVFTFCLTSCFDCRCDLDEPPKSMLFNIRTFYSKVQSLRYTVNMAPRFYSLLILSSSWHQTSEHAYVVATFMYVYFELRSEREPGSTSGRQLRIRKLQTKIVIFLGNLVFFYSCGCVPCCASLRCVLNVTLYFLHDLCKILDWTRARRNKEIKQRILIVSFEWKGPDSRLRRYSWKNNIKMYLEKWGPLMVAQWLRYCATNREVASSIPGGVICIFHWHNPSDLTMVLGSIQPLTEMSTRNISWG